MAFEGDFFQRSFYAALHTAQRRVDRYAAQSGAAATALSQLQESSVKVAGGFGPIVFEPGQMTWIQDRPGHCRDLWPAGWAIVADQLNHGMAAGVDAISNVAGATNNVSATAGISYAALDTAHALFGDSSMALVAQVMNGATYHKLIGANLTNTPQLFQAQNVLVVDILGKAVVVTDAPALYGLALRTEVLSLASGSITVMDGGDVITNIDTRNGQTTSRPPCRRDYTFGLGLKGYAWDTARRRQVPDERRAGNWRKLGQGGDEHQAHRWRHHHWRRCQVRPCWTRAMRSRAWSRP